ncbi:hypothetical protein KIW84_032123 [Lathyrus oleraceus]|uniref:HSA domain-containing protein n=1 Tax=Pisum sativum TaxID=3888 RepID=A0A9D5B1T1_PEA|nr:hypothetical protein KIW84_032123 [Pisum sativum]
MLMSGCYFISLENLARNLEGHDVTGDETASVYGIDVSHLSSNIEGAIQNVLHRSTCPLFEKSNDTSVFEMWSVSESDHKVPSGDLDDKQLNRRIQNLKSQIIVKSIIEVKRKRIMELSAHTLPSPVLRKSHWNFVLEEMAWMANDLARERLWKTAAAAQLFSETGQNISDGNIMTHAAGNSSPATDCAIQNAAYMKTSKEIKEAFQKKDTAEAFSLSSQKQDCGNLRNKLAVAPYVDSKGPESCKREGISKSKDRVNSIKSSVETLSTKSLSRTGSMASKISTSVFIGLSRLITFTLHLEFVWLASGFKSRLFDDIVGCRTLACNCSRFPFEDFSMP